MRVFWLILIGCFTLFLTPVSAQEDTGQFVIRLYGGEDTTAPTTPTLLTADGVAPTQVDITWSASTDNALLSGYVVFRDGSPIATTTLTNYSDTGLSASTTYSYFVRAFDFVNNYSSSSNALSATTPDNPAPPETPEQPDGTIARVVAEEVIITPGISTTSIYIKTGQRARLEIHWGRTASYELGYIVTEAYRDTYKAFITDLEPGTVYEYEIIGYTPYGKPNVVKRGRFTTLDARDLLPPTNISGFQGIAQGSDVRLSWRIPSDLDFSSVRIVRNHLGFPEDPNDGFVVYQGNGNSVIDNNILSRYSPVYYTAFAYDSSGNVSSGAVVVVYARSIPENSSVSDGYEIIPIGSIGQKESTTSDANVRIPELFELQIMQRGKTYTFEEKTITLSFDEPFVVSIPSNAIERHLKSIIVTLEDPTDNRQTFSFLLRLNKTQTAYEGVIAPLLIEGESGITVDIYDYQAYIVASYDQPLKFVSPDTLRDLFEPIDTQPPWQFILPPLVLLLILLLWLIARKRVEDKN